MRTPVVLLVSAAIAGCSAGSGAPEEADGLAAATFADADVQRIHGRMIEAMAPGGAWERNRYLQFDWIVDRGNGQSLARSHRWDRWTGDYRVEQQTDEGTMVALFNVGSPQDGQVWLDGVAQVGEEAQALLRRANGAYVNDSYWLIMPYKWADPGVNARFVGRETDGDGNTWDVVELSFEQVGLTPNNMYRAYVSPATGLMERWDHFRTPDAEPSPSVWTRWTDFSGVKLALDRSQIRFADVMVGEDVPADAFQPPTG